MIDCKLTKNYFREKRRMCGRNICFECPLSSSLNGKNKSCSALEQLYTSEAIEIVQRWSNRNPQRTLLTEFLERYPNVEMNSDGFPENIIPCYLGLMKRKDICKNMCLYFYDKGHPCYDCWNTITKKSEETE